MTTKPYLRGEKHFVNFGDPNFKVPTYPHSGGGGGLYIDSWIFTTIRRSRSYPLCVTLSSGSRYGICLLVNGTFWADSFLDTLDSLPARDSTSDTCSALRCLISTSSSCFEPVHHTGEYTIYTLLLTLHHQLFVVNIIKLAWLTVSNAMASHTVSQSRTRPTHPSQVPCQLSPYKLGSHQLGTLPTLPANPPPIY